MAINIAPELKRYLKFLSDQSLQVMQDFCKLAIDYVQKGLNPKIYSAAAQKLEVEPEQIKNTVEALVNLLLECCKHKLLNDDFRVFVRSLGFIDEKEAVLLKVYESKQPELTKSLSLIGFKLPQYHNLEWRFETQIASRSLLRQIEPQVTLDLLLKNGDGEAVEHTMLQTDPNNLLHLVQELEVALQEGQSQHVRRIMRTTK